MDPATRPGDCRAVFLAFVALPTRRRRRRRPPPPPLTSSPPPPSPAAFFSRAILSFWNVFAPKVGGYDQNSSLPAAVSSWREKKKKMAATVDGDAAAAAAAPSSPVAPSPAPAAGPDAPARTPTPTQQGHSAVGRPATEVEASLRELLTAASPREREVRGGRAGGRLAGARRSGLTKQPTCPTGGGALWAPLQAVVKADAEMEKFVKNKQQARLQVNKASPFMAKTLSLLAEWYGLELTAARDGGLLLLKTDRTALYAGVCAHVGNWWHRGGAHGDGGVVGAPCSEQAHRPRGRPGRRRRRHAGRGDAQEHQDHAARAPAAGGGGAVAGGYASHRGRGRHVRVAGAARRRALHGRRGQRRRRAPAVHRGARGSVRAGPRPHLWRDGLHVRVGGDLAVRVGRQHARAGRVRRRRRRRRRTHAGPVAGARPRAAAERRRWSDTAAADLPAVLGPGTPLRGCWANLEACQRF